MDHGTSLLQNEHRALRFAALGGVVGPLLFVLLVIVGGLLDDGYSHVTQKISELGGEGAEFAALQNANFILLGVLTVAFAWALARTLGRPYLGAVLIGIFGVSSAIANGLLPCDLGCQGATSVGLAHNVAGMFGFLCAIGGMVVLARRWRDDPAWRRHVAPTVGAVVVASAGLIWFVFTQALDRQALAGIAQRTFVVALLAWLATTAWRLWGDLADG